MPGRSEYEDTLLGITFRTEWLNSPGEMVPPEKLSLWVRQIYANYRHLDELQAITILTVWHPDRADCPEIKGYAGLTYWNGRIDLNAKWLDAGDTSHEVGHWAAFKNLMHPESPNPWGRKMAALYTILRGRDFTTATPHVERWAEDFRSLFGADGVKGTLHPNDDFYKGIGVRHVNAVPGLFEFMDNCDIILDRWQQTGDIQNEKYDADAKAWTWTSPGSWWQRTYEWSDGASFYVWDWYRGWVRRP